MIKIGKKNYQYIEDYAKANSKTIQTVYNWIKDGKVKSRKMLNKTLIEL